MDWLPSCGIVHSDLKASNVLIREVHRSSSVDWEPFVADYECSNGVVGTRCLRALEIVEVCKEWKVSERPVVFSRAVHAHAYGMTCYAILSGKLPFGGLPFTDYDLVFNGQRPIVPECVDDWICELLSRYEESNSAVRLTVGEILNFNTFQNS